MISIMSKTKKGRGREMKAKTSILLKNYLRLRIVLLWNECFMEFCFFCNGDFLGKVKSGKGGAAENSGQEGREEEEAARARLWLRR